MLVREKFFKYIGTMEYNASIVVWMSIILYSQYTIVSELVCCISHSMTAWQYAQLHASKTLVYSKMLVYSKTLVYSKMLVWARKAGINFF